jgi:archaellum component FlaC
MDKLDDIKNSLSRIEDKLDSHLERISRAEESIVWLKGHVKLVTALGLAIAGTLISIFFKGA